jgi:hypothetical protein
MHVSDRLYETLVMDLDQEMTKSNRVNVGRVLEDVKTNEFESGELVYKLVATYIMFRPDIGYITPMVHLADTLIYNLDD